VVASAAPMSRKKCPKCGSAFGGSAAFCPNDGTALDEIVSTPEAEADPYLGTTIAGDVEIRSLAGSGAMGNVYRAHQTSMERDVAVKILRSEVSGNAQVVQRFHREAKIASKLQHPHVVEIYFTGQLPDGALFIVMEFLEGQSLAAALEKAGGTMPVDRALAIALQVCDAVGEGHARGIVHRDLKPENVMLVKRGENRDFAKVLDFGIAKASLGEQSHQTQAGLIFGTARYISPEGAGGATVGAPGDVYALATIVYQMLVGSTPFDAEQTVGILLKHINEPPRDLRSWPAGVFVPEPIAAVVMDNLAKDPKQRAENARAFGAALANAAHAADVAPPRSSYVALGVVPHPKASVAPTLDDAAGVRAPMVTNATEPLARVTAPTPLPVSAPPAPAPEDRKASAPPPKHGRPWLLVVVAFLLGAALVAVGMQLFTHRVDADHVAYVAKTRHALADSRYVSPPGDNVRDLVTKGLERWPNDPDLLQLRSTASIELVTRSMVEEKSGDVAGARELALHATELDPTDHIAALRLKDCDDTLRQLAGDAGLTTGPPRVVLGAKLATARPGDKVEVTARLIPGAAGAKAKASGVRFQLFDHLDPKNGKPIPFAETSPLSYTATLVAPPVGNYDIVFSAAVDATNVRAQRELGVVAP
jgi:serine/threonine-protein kinase